MSKPHRLPDPGLSSLQALFDRTSWERGRSYARQGRVLQLELEPDPNAEPGWLISASVRGSYGANYHTSVDLGRDEQGQWWLAGACSCPVGVLCKHQAALVQRVAERHPDVVPVRVAAPAPVVVQPRAGVTPAPVAPARLPSATGPSLERWWAGLTQGAASLPVGRNVLAEDEVLLFALSLQTEALHHRQAVRRRLLLGCRRVKRLKGRQGKAQLFGKLREFGNVALSDLLAGDDLLQREVMQWLAAEATVSGHLWGRIQDADIGDRFGLQLLERVVRSGRAVSADEDGYPGPAWQWGEQRRLDWQWQQAGSRAQEQWQLRAVIDGKRLGGSAQQTGVLPVPGAVSLYVDWSQHQIGLLDLGGLKAEQIESLLTAPELSQAWLERQGRLALHYLPSLPGGIGQLVVRRIAGMMPGPVLQIRFGPDGEPQFDLRFDYAGLRGVWADRDPQRLFVETPDGLVDLQRDLDSERQAVHACAQHGLAPQPSGQIGSWCIAGAEAAARQQLFAAWLGSDFAAWRAAGFQIERPKDWHERVRGVEQIDIGLDRPGAAADLDDIDAEGAAGWLHLSIGFRFGERRFDLLPWLPQLVAQAQPGPDGVLQAPEQLWISDAEGGWWGLPGAALQPWLTALIELVGERPAADFQAGHLALTRIEALRLGAETIAVDLPQGRGGLAVLADIVRAHRQDVAVALPDGLRAELRPYQRTGLAWLQALARHQLGGVLADDMGLGKTLQVIAHLRAEQARGALDRPALVVVPTSLVGNWRRECARFAPALRVLVLHGAERHDLFDQVASHDVVLTTYPLLPRDAEVLLRQSWHAVVLDEAQTIKNARTQAAQVVQMLQARHRLCLSGTPMENHLGEIWSLFEFLLPGYLGREPRFKALFRTPIEKHGDTARLALLRRRLAPFMLRRSKDMVATELPPKVETLVRVQFDEKQANLYETIRLGSEQSVQEALQARGLARSQIMVLDALLKLRQVCCDPRLVKIRQARKVHSSAKLEWLQQTLPELVAEGRRVLLFSQFTSMLELVEQALAGTGLSWVKLTGESIRRDALVEQFTSGAVPLFLISLKAGGVGLNLPQADTVIHCDPWWNPAVENQATDRAHRLGQTRTVFVYRLVVEGTLEERILALQQRKAQLAAGLHGDTTDTGPVLTEADLAWLLQPLGAVVEADADAVTVSPQEDLDAR